LHTSNTDNHPDRRAIRAVCATTHGKPCSFPRRAILPAQGRRWQRRPQRHCPGR